MDERPELPRPRRTKIIATLGPASYHLVGELIAAGVDVFRLNLSHGDKDAHTAAVAHVRTAAQAAGRHVGILADLQGVKVRTHLPSAGSLTVAEGETLLVADADQRYSAALYLSPGAVLRSLAEDHPILIEDGKIRLRVVKKCLSPLGPVACWQCVVEVGGVIRHRKGVNLPRTPMPHLPPLTEQDQRDLAWGVRQGVDGFALSFVRSAEPVAAAKQVVRELGADTPVVAKLERPEIIGHLNDILGAADGVMIARGDLGVELPLEQLPGIQRRTVAAAREMLRPVIVATQMLESMTAALVPTRAEAQDIASAVHQGADAVMLSGETAAGQHPVEAVRTMDRIVTAAELDVAQAAHDAAEANPGAGQLLRLSARGEHQPVDINGALATAAATAGRAKAICVYTQDGLAARRVAGHRPDVRVDAFSERLDTLQRLALVWGIIPHHLPHSPALGVDFVQSCETVLREQGVVGSGDLIVLVSKTLFDEGGTTAGLLLHKLK